MQIDEYLEAIGDAILYLGDNPSYLVDLANKASEDNEIGTAELDAIKTEISLCQQSLSSEKSSGGTYRPESFFPRYALDDDDDDMPCGLKAHRIDEFEIYSHWLRDVFLPTFHPLPNGKIQYPVIACLMLLNSMAAKKNDKFPLVWIQGFSGCGKSNLMESFAYHYPTPLVIKMQPDSTGASLRDEIDAKVGRGEPGILLFNNLWIKDTLFRLGVHRSILLANNKNDAISHLSTRGDNNQKDFRTHCIKVVSTVDDGKDGATGNGMEELTRRLWIVLCAKTGATPPSRDAYSWKGMIDAYNQIWGHENKEAVNTTYASYLQKVKKYPKDDTFDMSIWELLYVPLAVWQFVGLGTLEEGIKAFKTHRDWVYSIDNTQTDILLQTMRNFMERYDPKRELAPWESPADLNLALVQISPTTIKSHVEQVLPDLNVNQRLLDERITPIMNTFGFKLSIVNNKAVYVKI